MSAVVNMSSPSNTEEEKVSAKEAKRLRLRAKSITELVETEIQYVSDLEVLTEVYIEPLSPNQCNIINAEQHRLLFNNIPALIKLNTQFKMGLEQRYNDWDPFTSKIADQFLQFAPYFHMYQGYLNSHEQAAGLVAKLYIRSSKFKKFIDNAQFSNPKCNGLDLRSYLVKPLQRITKYSLLLRELMKHTTENHPDYNDLQQAMGKINQVNATINEKMKTFDQRQKVRDIQARFTQNNIDLVSPARYFIKEGKLTKICRKKDVVYIFILFSDLLIYGEQTNEGSGSEKKKDYLIKIHQQIPINQSFKTRDIPQNAKYGAKCWEIHSPEKSFIVYADHPGLKQEWLREINSVVAARSTIESGKQRPAALWVPDDFTNECMIHQCDHKFNVINRRHHCRYCGRLVCGPCSNNKLPHWNKTNKSVRVCNLCYSENKELKDLQKKRAATQVISDNIVDAYDEDSMSVDSDIDFEFWDSTEEDEETVDEEAAAQQEDLQLQNMDCLEAINNTIAPMTRSRSSNLNGRTSEINEIAAPELNHNISIKQYRRSTKKKRGRMLSKARIKELHQRSASLGARDRTHSDTDNKATNRGIFSHQAKIFRLSYKHTPKKSTRTVLYELNDLSFVKRNSLDPSLDPHLRSHTATNSFASESLPHHSDVLFPTDDEKRSTPVFRPKGIHHTSAMTMPSTSSLLLSSPRSSATSNRRLKLVGTGTLNIEAHQYDHELVSMRLHTFTEVIDWNLDPYSMKPRKKDSTSCYLKALNVLSQQNEILLIRITNKDIMASLVTILLSLGYYYEAENANRDDDDIDSNEEKNGHESEATVALSKDTTLEEHKAEIDRAVFLIENSRKHENIKTIDVAKFLIAKSCPVSVIEHAFNEAGVEFPRDEIYRLTGKIGENKNESRNRKLREKEKQLALRNGKRAMKTSNLLGFDHVEAARKKGKKRTKSNDFGITKAHKRFSRKKMKPIKLKQSHSADVNVGPSVVQEFDFWLPPHTKLADSISDTRYQEALYQHDIRFCLIHNVQTFEREEQVLMPSDKLDAHLRDTLDEMAHYAKVCTNRANKLTLSTSLKHRNGKSKNSPRKNGKTKEEKKKKQQKKNKIRSRFSIWGKDKKKNNNSVK